MLVCVTGQTLFLGGALTSLSCIGVGKRLRVFPKSIGSLATGRQRCKLVSGEAVGAIIRHNSSPKVMYMLTILLRCGAKLLVGASFLVVGCSAADHSSSLKVAAQPAGITYYNRIGPLFANRCASCHYQGNPVQIVGGLADATYQGNQTPAFKDYESIKNNAQLAVTMIKAGLMPPAKNLGSTDAADLQTWIDTGMPEGDPATAPKESLLVKSIIDRRCVGCHHPGGTNDLTQYESASGPLHASVIYAALNLLQNMPPAKNLTPEELTTLSDWSAAGGPREGYDGTHD